METKTHDHNHTHAPAKFGGLFAVATALNIGIVLTEVVFGLATHSTALLADAAHNTGDVIGLMLAWGAYVLAQRQPTKRFTYGLRSSTVLAALLNGMLLMVATGAIVWEAIRRFSEPVPVEGGVVMAIAALAIVLNGFSAWLLSRGQKDDINVQSAFWHLVADAAVSAGVVVAAFLIVKTGIQWIDSIASIAIAATIVWSTWGLFRESIRLSLQAVPSSIDIDQVNAYLINTPNVIAIHDLHVWPISTTETALTCHFVVHSSFDSSSLTAIVEELDHRFKINHSTIQLESEDGSPCALAPKEIV